MENAPEQILNFLHAVEQLKNELRHSWTSKGRQESVAEHSWRLSLMVMICAPYLQKKIDLLKALKLAILHDIGEAKIGDKHYLDVISSEESVIERSQIEGQSVRELTELLGSKGNTLFDFWIEFEDRRSEEAKFVFLLDKLEVCIQHCEADISTWTEKEKATLEKYFNDLEVEDDFLFSLKEAIKIATYKKINMI